MATIAIVGRHLPGHQIGLEKCGAASHLRGIVEHFRSRGDRVVFVLLAPRITSFSIAAEELAYELVGPSIRRIGGRYVVGSPRSLAATAAYVAFRRCPARVREAIDRARMTVRRWRGFTHVLGSLLTGAERRYVRAAVRRHGPDVILYDDVFMYCPGLEGPEQWIIAHDVKYQRSASLGAQGYHVVPHGFGEREEREILRRCGNVLAIQWDDAEEFRRLAPSARVVVAPVTFERADVVSERRPVAGRCVFVASGALPNLDGIRWFIDTCWQRVRAAVPFAELHIYGTVCERLGAVPDGVRTVGVVDDVTSAYAEAAAVIVPLRIGSGLKVKLVEAFVHGVPAVTTPVGAQGLGAIRPVPFAPAADADEFVDALVRLFRDGGFAHRIESAARDAARRFAPATAYADLDAALRPEAAAPLPPWVPLEARAVVASGGRSA